ncbi:hypothetical protein ASPZODRAFT_130545 [Penicilliopsis zonata CBS 506.65]|uniref:UBX domain-containing protein n=1 Tax=Penicilliopsis zonata CBS 506.65 TaxID=1073090 RepID=A0A1L9SN03_9EURO|nr:hypothetical protein ASPZODRAFT_130545 [Penicilliopsis zonata CBS 506.65]OJJ48496.1 hypothetical protein ASPZODRAFT_130545 [Penicilliopsis zonata CBS 506.65]
MDAPNPTPDEILSQFCAITGMEPSEAQNWLMERNLDEALSEYFADPDAMTEEAAAPSGGSSIGRRLGNDDETESATGQSLGDFRQPPSKKAVPQKKFATLGDFAARAGDSTDEEDDENQDFFAGGEKSGLAVQNPDDIKRKILEKARKSKPPSADDSEPLRSNFTGTARTLGGDDAPSRVIESQASRSIQQPPRVQRTLHFWADGFSVDDGDLYRSDDPRNAEVLEGIRQGRAPLSIMNVQPGQEVDVEIKQHEEKYIKPKPKYKPFSGQGQRLGSPTPMIKTQQAPTTTAAKSSEAPSDPVRPTVDESQPVVTLQVRLGDGSRLTSRFNTTHTIGDVYDFVSAASPVSQSRPWVLMTTFPNKELTDKAAVLGDLADFKRGGVVVQKWQ